VQDTIRLSDLMGLMQSNHGPCVTIMMSTHISGPDEQQDALTLRNLTDRAQEALATGWLRASQARDWLEPIRKCSSDPDFWEKRNLGLALFLNGKSLQRFRVPIPLEEVVLVNHRFFIKPLLRLASGNHRFLVLTVSQHQVILYEATEFQIERLTIPNLPQQIVEALNIQGEDRGQQRHMANRWGKGKQTSVFHGQGGVKETHKAELNLFFNQIDEALGPILRHHHAPMILAGVDYLLPILRKSLSYPNILEGEVHGNWDYSAKSELLRKAWPIARPELIKQQARVAERIRDLTNSDLATCDPQTAIKAACEGRVDSLLVDIAEHHWGRCDQFGQVFCTHEHPQAGDDDLMDHAVAQTMLHGGKVYVVEAIDMPTSSPIAALLRY